MWRKIKLFVILPVIILLASLRLATLTPTPPAHLQLQPSPSPLGPDYIGWKEYENETYHYLIKHPHNWYFHQTDINPPPPTTIRLSNVSEDRTNAPHVSVEIFVDERLGRTLDTYEEITNLVAQGHVARQLEVSKAPAVLIDHLGDSGELANMYVEHGDYIYRLSWSGTHHDVRKHFKDKCLAIMVSLTFLD